MYNLISLIIVAQCISAVVIISFANVLSSISNSFNSIMMSILIGIIYLGVLREISKIIAYNKCWKSEFFELGEKDDYGIIKIDDVKTSENSKILFNTYDSVIASILKCNDALSQRLSTFFY